MVRPPTHRKTKSHPSRLVPTQSLSVTLDHVAEVNRLTSNNRSLVVAISGGVKDAGAPTIQSALAVYFGNGSRHNFSAMIPEGQADKQNATELYAATIALETIQGTALAANVNLIIVKTSNPYIPSAINKKSWGLERHDYTESTGEDWSIPYAGLVLNLHEICKQFEDEDITIRLWKVKTGQNSEGPWEENLEGGLRLWQGNIECEQK